MKVCTGMGGERGAQNFISLNLIHISGNGNLSSVILDLLNSLCDKYYWFWVIVAYSAANNAINCIFAVNLLPIRWLVIMINVCKRFAAIAYKLCAILVSIQREMEENESICTRKANKRKENKTLINLISVRNFIFPQI